MTRKAVLFIGTFSPPVTGQSAAFELIYERYDGEKYKINKWPYLPGVLGKVFTHFKVGILTLYYLIFKKIDVIYATTFSSVAGSASDIILFTINKFFNKKVIIHSHGSQFRNIIENSGSPLKQILTYLLRDIDKAVVLFDGMKSQFNWLISESNIFVIPNCYDPVLDSAKVLKKHQSGMLRIGYISNLMYVKGIVHLIDAVKILKEKGMNVTLSIAGQYLDDYQMSAEELRTLIDGRVKDIDYIKYLGPVRGQSKIQFFEEIDVFCLPSFYKAEAQPLSIIEAYRSGCAVLACDINYISEMVKPENGVVVKPESSMAIADALEEMYNTPERLRSIQEYNVIHALQQYSPDRYVSGVIRLFS